MSYRENFALIDWSKPIEIERKPELPVARSPLPFPMIISDEMPETEQVDGKFYTSKSTYRRVGRSLGLIEVGNEKMPAPTKRKPDRQAIKTAVEKAIARSKG